MKVELTRGGWAQFRDDIDDITNRERRAVLQAYETEGSDVARGEAIASALVRLLVTEWSYDLPIPKDDPDSLLDIRGKDFDLLTQAALEAQGEMFIDFAPNADDNRPT